MSRASPTNSGIQACLAGTLKANTVPVMSAMMNTCQTAMTSVWISTAKPADVTAIVAWLITVSQRLWSRSAATPPIKVNANCGMPQPRLTNPSDVAVPVNSNVRKPCAVIIIWIAVKEKSMLIQSRRKCLFLNAANVPPRSPMGEWSGDGSEEEVCGAFDDDFIGR